MADNNSNDMTIEKPTSTTKSHGKSSDEKSHRRKRYDRSRSSSVKHHRHKRSRSRSRSRHRHHHHEKRHRHSRSRSPRRKRSRSRSRRQSPRRRSSPVQNRNIHTESRITEDDRKRIQLETLQRLKDMAANDTLDLSNLTIEDLKKAIDVPKEIRANQAATAMYQMDEIKKLIEELTGISIPKTYNANNPLQYAQQQRKRKLLWSKTNDKTSTSKVGAAITDGQDEKTAEKFRKLLGMKTSGSNDTIEMNAIHQQQQNTFDSLDKEYETARITTHLLRGVGLGFRSQGPFVPSSTEKN